MLQSCDSSFYDVPAIALPHRQRGIIRYEWEFEHGLTEFDERHSVAVTGVFGGRVKKKSI